jgi:magnesium transporter
MTQAATLPLLDQLAREFVARHPADAARTIHDLDVDAAADLLATSRPSETAMVLARLGPDMASRLVRRLPADVGRRVLAEADPGVATALLRRLETDDDRAAVLHSLPAARRRELETFLAYPENSAGSLMDPQAPVFRADARAGDVADALHELRRFRDEVVMVVDDEGRLLGTLATVKALLAEPDVRLAALGPQRSPSVQAFAPREDVAELIEHQRMTAIPVVGIDERPVGVLSQRALAHVAEQEVAADMQSMVGVSRDERALSSVMFAVRKRLPWLQINLVTAFLAASVVGMFESTIAAYTALAVLMPVVAGQSGNTGAQSLAVTMRGLTLREIGLGHWLRIVSKEASVGFLNGVAVAATTSAAVYLWSGSFGLSSVIGVAMVLSMTIAGIAGASVPMALRASGQDPAQSSSIVLTTVTDVTGFLTFLGLAAVFSQWL